MHNRELRVELERFSEYLYTRKNLIFFSGWSYNFFRNTFPQVSVYLTLIPNCNNRETIIWIRDELIYFFENNNWQERDGHGDINYILISLRFEEDGETRFNTAVREISLDRATGAVIGIWYWKADSMRRVLTLDEIKGNKIKNYNFVKLYPLRNSKTK